MDMKKAGTDRQAPASAKMRHVHGLLRASVAAVVNGAENRKSDIFLLIPQTYVGISWATAPNSA